MVLLPVIVIIVSSFTFVMSLHWIEKARLRREIASLKDRLGVGDEQARREIVANFRRQAVEDSKITGLEDRARRLLNLANEVEQNGEAT